MLKTALFLLVCRAILLFCCTAAFGAVKHDIKTKAVIITDGQRQLELRLSYDGRCMLDRVIVRGQSVVPTATGVCSGIKVKNQWYTTRAVLRPVHVTTTSNTVVVEGIRFGGAGMDVEETWRLTSLADRITWRVDRKYLSTGVLDDTYFPGWDFNSMSTWTGALLGHGGVAWSRLFDAPNASYGVHNGEVAFWNKSSRAALRLIPRAQSGTNIAVRFSRQPNGIFSFNYTVAHHQLEPKHGLSRFSRESQDIWAPFEVQRSQVGVEYTLIAFDYEKAYELGQLQVFDAATIRETRHTIARIGAVDELVHGSNGYYSDCAVLHEPWLAQLGILIDDTNYTRALAETLDFQRQHAIEADGRVKSRWAGTPGDAMRGTYDRFGYYEAQWGYLLDSQPSWVINVAELFDLTGDRSWLARQKEACELVLEYILRRDSDGNGLVEMVTDSHKQARGSDWIDVVWASYENALVNAQLYWAMILWADREELLGDKPRAERYRAASSRLKQQFNRTIFQGGFWDPENRSYVYWREKDGSVHGTNIVIPVNFSAIGYGLCDEPSRRAAILERVESLMQAEQLFFWPLCFFGYAEGEAHSSQYPFPTYENGDLFLAWGELGTRAYAGYDSGTAVKYVKNVFSQYSLDGLAFQRYSRRTQTGAGNDILANNCSAIIGLYRNIYGVQPRYNRLLLQPHLVPDLNGTHLEYWLRGQLYRIDLSTEGNRVSVEDLAVTGFSPFGLNVTNNVARYFFNTEDHETMSLVRSVPAPLDLRLEKWSDDPIGLRRWTQLCPQSGVTVSYVVTGLKPGTSYRLIRAGQESLPIQTDDSGRLGFDCHTIANSPLPIEITPK